MPTLTLIILEPKFKTMIITKVSIKVLKSEWMAIFEYINLLQVEIIGELNGRSAVFSSEKMCVYDYAPRIITQGKLQTWENYVEGKLYAMNLPIGVAVCMMKILMVETNMEFSLRGFSGRLYASLINYFDHGVFDGRKSPTKLGSNGA